MNWSPLPGSSLPLPFGNSPQTVQGLHNTTWGALHSSHVPLAVKYTRLLKAGSPAPPPCSDSQCFLLTSLPLLFLPPPFPLDPSLPTNTLPQTPVWKAPGQTSSQLLMVRPAHHSSCCRLTVFWLIQHNSQSFHYPSPPPPPTNLACVLLGVPQGCLWPISSMAASCHNTSICYPIQVTHKSALPPTGSDFWAVRKI